MQTIARANRVSEGKSNGLIVDYIGIVKALRKALADYAYNAEQNRATIEKTFMDLMELASSLDTEQQRYVREGFSSDEELSVYDLLFSENLTKQEIETIKKVSVDLLTKIKQQIAKLDHWTDKQETKAIVDNLIRNTLWQELPNSYDVSDIQTYQKKIYEYVYMRYPEVA